MNTFSKFLIVGMASVAIVGFAGYAVAGGPDTHVMTVQLPDGSVEQIRYSGDVKPEIMVDPGFAGTAFAGPAAWNDPFAAFARISADMDREMSGLLREAGALSTQPFASPADLGTTEAAFGALPRGAESYSFASTVSGNGVCGQSIQVTSEGPGQKPRVVSKRFGDCGASSAATTGERPGLSQAKSTATANPYAGLVREASWQ